MRAIVVAGLLAACLSFCGMAAAGTLDEVLFVVDGTSWGSPSQTVRNGLGQTPLLENNEILMIPGDMAGRPATISYLFNPTGALYNLAWYAAIPVAKMAEAQRVEAELEQALTAKYGPPFQNFSDGDAGKAESVAADAAKQEGEREKILEEIRFKKAQGLEKEAMQLTARLFMNMPMIFYSKLAMWDGGDVLAYTNLLCSTDGTCYMHMQFVSKNMTAHEKYAATPDVLFSYSPADRDQDMVTKYNRTLEMQNRK